MNELYKEIMVKRKTQPIDTAKKAGMIALVVLSFLVGFLFIPIMMIGTAYVLGCVYVRPANVQEASAFPTQTNFLRRGS